MIGTTPASSITASYSAEESALFWMEVKPDPKILQQDRDYEANLTSTKLRNTLRDDVTPEQLQSDIVLITSKGTEEKRAEHNRHHGSRKDSKQGAGFLSSPQYFSFCLALAALLSTTDCSRISLCKLQTVCSKGFETFSYNRSSLSCCPWL